jgi:radical SAM superfamily enzyme YgiQ (UPF0313 family)
MYSKIYVTVRREDSLKLLLIAPADADMAGQEGKQLHHLSLAIIAALAEPDFDEVEIVEEHHTALDLDARADLVGITMMTCQAPRGYWLADHFRRRGIPTIAGGSHASFMVEQCLEHFDSVVVGEVEPVWSALMADFKRGRLAPSYKAAKLPDLRDLPIPRKDLFRGKTTLNAGVIQTSRGCPLGCGYCTVTTLYGREYRTRPVEAVVEEIRRYPSKNFLIVDDNVFFSHAYSRQLFEALMPLKIKWFSQASLDLACRDKSLLKLAARSGCVGLFVGIESLDQDTLNAAHKQFNRVGKYKEHLATMRRTGLTIVGAFMFGFEQDTPATFDRVYDFAVRNRLATITPGIVTPLPGTALYRSMDSNNLILDRDWRHYTCEVLVSRHPTMSRAEIHQHYDALSRRFYSWRSIAARFLGNLRHPLFYLGMNLANRSRIYGLASTESMLPPVASAEESESCSPPEPIMASPA